MLGGGVNGCPLIRRRSAGGRSAGDGMGNA